MVQGYVAGRPGFHSEITATHRVALRGGQFSQYYAGGKTIDGAKSRDSGNTGYITTLRSGLLMGRITSGGKYRPSVIGVVVTATVVGATTVNVSAAQAVELNRLGTTGTFVIRGPAITGGPVDSETATYSAVNTTTGDITVTALTKPYLAGSFVQPADGADVPISVIPDGFGVKVVDADGVTSIDIDFDPVPVGGVLVTAMVPLYPTEPSLRRWLKDAMRLSSPDWLFDLDF